MNSRELKEFLAGESAYGTTLLLLLVSKHGAESMNWDPETIRLEMDETFDAKLSDVHADRLQALCLAQTSDLFYSDVQTFIHVSNALGGSGVNFQMFDPATIEEAAWATTEVLMNDPDGIDIEAVMSEEVKEYLRQEALFEGRATLPEPFSFIDMPEGANKNMADAAVMGEDFASAVSSTQAELREEITSMVRERMKELCLQVSALGLPEIDQQSWSQYCRTLLGETASQPSAAAQG